MRERFSRWKVDRFDPPWAIAFLVFAIFSPALRNDFVVWDDNILITENPHFRGFSSDNLRWMFGSFYAGHYHPLTWVSYGIDYSIWGLDPRGYHLTNLVLHVGVATILYLVLVEILQRSRIDGGTPNISIGGAVVGSLFFALHPLRAESVAWVSARRDCLSGLFYLVTVWSYLKSQNRLGIRQASRWRFLSLTCFALSLLSKGWSVTLPVVLVALDLHLGRFGPNREARRRALLDKVPYLCLAVVGAAVSVSAAGPVSQLHSFTEHGALARILQAAYGLLFSLWKTAIPTSLSPLYPIGTGIDFGDPRYLLSLAFAVCVLGASALLYHRFRWLLPFWLAYLASIFPFLGFFQSGPQLVADRYVYLASFVLAVVVGSLFCRAYTQLRRPKVVTGVAIALLAGLGTLTFRQTRVWQDTMTLWSHAIQVTPKNSVAYTNRAWVRQGEGDLDGALADLGKAIASNPKDPAPYNNRGALRRRLGDYEGAVSDFQQGLRVAHASTRWHRYLERNLASVKAFLNESRAETENNSEATIPEERVRDVTP